MAIDAKKLFGSRPRQALTTQALQTLQQEIDQEVDSTPVIEVPSVRTGEPALLWDPPETPKEFVAWDSETFLITPGNLTPQLVCVQWQHNERLANGFWQRTEPMLMGGTLEDIHAGACFIRALIEESDVVLVTHNGPFDYCVLLNYFNWSKRLMRAIITAYRAGRLRDTMIMGKLHAIERGWMEYDPDIQAPAKFSLGDMILKYTGQHIEGKHGPDVWRLNYHKLFGVARETWPDDALSYALLDPVYTADLFIALLSAANISPDESFQSRKAFILHLGSVQGLATDQERVRDLESKILPKIEAGIAELTKLGIYRPPTYHPRKEMFASLVEKALGGAVERTPKGEVSLSEKQIRRACSVLNKSDADLLTHRSDTEWLRNNAPDYVEERPGSKNMQLLYQAVSDHFEGNPPRTASDRVSTARKVLKEVPLLKPLVDIGEAQKVKTTYLPVLRQPIVNPRANPLVSSGRNSYSGPNIANQPRMEGVRECWVAPMQLIELTEDE